MIRPGFGRSSMTVAWLDRVDHACIEARLRVTRLVFGVICLLYAAYVLVASFAGSVALAAFGGAEAGGVLALFGIAMALGAGLLGLLLVATARGREVTVGDGLHFPCGAAGPWHLARIDEGRMHAVGERFID